MRNRGCSLALFGLVSLSAATAHAEGEELVAPGRGFEIPVLIRSDKDLFLRRPATLARPPQDEPISPGTHMKLLRPGERYEVIGPGFPTARFMLPYEEAATIDIHAIPRPQSKIGKALLGVGSSLTGIGVIMTVTTLVVYLVKNLEFESNLGSEPCYRFCSSPSGSSSTPSASLSLATSISVSNPYGQTLIAAGVLYAVGLPMLITGAVLLGSDRRFKLSPGTLRLSGSASGGLWLTARGLAF
ncbi:MAG: hypothetical protein U1A78_25955 [Polyangia bacterium]